MKKLKALVLFDVPYETLPVKGVEDFLTTYVELSEWKTERDVVKALDFLGHEIQPFGIHDDLRPLLRELEKNRPDVVFNLCESFGGDRSNEPNIVAMLNLLNIPCTGASPGPLRLCKDKGLTKRVLGADNIRVPHFGISHRSRPLKTCKGMEFPLFIKPLGLDGSEGITQSSLVHTAEDALEKINVIHSKYEVDAIIEEYIDGRELYVGVIGSERLTVLPPRELFFRTAGEHIPRIATFKAKWDEAYRKRWGIVTDMAAPLDSGVEKHLVEVSKQIYRAFEIDGYARFDFRLSKANELVFIEANPNPSIARDEDFALAAVDAGFSYEELIGKIIGMAVN